MGSARASVLVVALSFAAGSTAQFWVERQVLPPPDVTEGGLFGWSVSMEGDLMLVGAPGSSDLEEQSGAAYLFQRNNGGEEQWDLQVKLVPTGITPGARFGSSVILSGGRAFVGAPLDIVNGIAQGAVYIFAQDAGGTGNWGLVQRVSSAQGSLNMRLGEHLSKGEFLIAGVPDYDINPSGSSNPLGGIAVFHENAQGLFQFLDLYNAGGSGRSIAQFASRCFTGTTTSCLITPFDSLLTNEILYAPLPFASQLEPTEAFGYANNMVGSNLVSTAERAFATVRTTAFLEVHSFVDDAVDIVEDGAILPDTTLYGTDARFGESLTAEGDRLVVGAPGGQVVLPLGWAGVYMRDLSAQGGWRQLEKLVPSDPGLGDVFGLTVGLSGDDVAVGAPGHGADNRGKVYVFTDPQAGLPEVASAVMVALSPVPADDHMRVEIQGGRGPMEVHLIDALGRQRMQARVMAGSVSLTTTDLDAGHYFLRIIDNGLLIATERCVVVH